MTFCATPPRIDVVTYIKAWCFISVILRLLINVKVGAEWAGGELILGFRTVSLRLVCLTGFAHKLRSRHRGGSREKKFLPGMSRVCISCLFTSSSFPLSSAGRVFGFKYPDKRRAGLCVGSLTFHHFGFSACRDGGIQRVSHCPELSSWPAKSTSVSLVLRVRQR